MPFSKYFSFTFFLLLSALSPLAHARDRVDSYEKLNLLRRATGSENTSENSFQARVDAILNPSSDPEKSYIAAQDEAARAKAQAQQQAQLEGPIQASFSVSASPSPDNGMVKSKDENTRVKSLVESSEASFQKTLQERAEKAKSEPETAAPAPSSRSSKEAKDKEEKLLPSLANNPFYNKNQMKAEDPIRRFEANKAIIASRLAMSPLGESRAQEIVSRASSEEELTLMLMRDPDMSYEAIQEAIGTDEPG